MTDYSVDEAWYELYRLFIFWLLFLGLTLQKHEMQGSSDILGTYTVSPSFSHLCVVPDNDNIHIYSEHNRRK